MYAQDNNTLPVWIICHKLTTIFPPILSHFWWELYQSGIDVDYIEDSLKGENNKNSKEDDYTNMDEEKEGKQADLPRSKIT